MEDVRFYDFECNLLHVEHDIISCNWMLYENQVGTFEMHVPVNRMIVQVVMQNRYIVVVQGDKQAIITGKRLGKDAVFYGKTCNWILSRFYITEPFNTDELYDKGWLESKDAQRICQYVVEEGMGRIENFVFEACGGGFGDVFLENTDVSSVLSLVEACVKQVQCGYEVFFDVKNKRWVFRLFKGKLLTFVLSEEYRNCYDVEYFEDIQDYFTGGFFWQEQEDGTSVLTKIPSALEGIYAWETDLAARTEQEAKDNLKQYCVQRQTDARICNLAYGRDYGLNDTVQLRMQKGEFFTKEVQRFVGVHLWYEENSVGEQPILEGEVA